MSSADHFLRRFRFGLEGKFVVLATVVIVVATAIGNRLIFAYEEDQLVQQLRRETAAVAASMAHAITYTLIYEELGLVEEAGLLDLFIEYLSSQSGMDVRYVGVLNSEDRVIAHTDYRRFGDLESGFRQRHSPDLLGASTTIADIGGHRLLEVAAPLNVATKSWGTLVLAVSLEPINKEVTAFAYRLGVLTLGAMALAVLVAFLVARTLARPIKRLAVAMSEVDPRLESRIETDRRDEIGLLQTSFLEMLERLREARQEQERTRAAMVRAEKLASIGSLASGVAHEVNNPLGGIRNCLSQLTAHPGDPQRLAQYLPLMARAVERIERVVRGLLDFSHRRAYEPCPVDLRSLTEEALSLADHRLENSNINLSMDIVPDLPPILGDRHQLQQIVVNLVLNAVDAMASGGQLQIRVYRGQETAVLEIEDTGPGIDPELVDRIFDPFFSTKGVGEGTGLGLTVSLSIAREHGGDLSYSSGSGGGAVFTLNLPYGAAVSRGQTEMVS